MGSEKPWRSKEFLYQYYVVKKLTIDEIAAECKKLGHSVTPMTIYNNLKTHNLIRNSRNLGQRSYGPARASNKPTGGKPKGKFY